MAILTSLAAAATPAAAETLVGRVVGVTDGSTVRLVVDGRRQYKVRLGEIDAPENGQPFGRASKRMLSNLVYGKTVSVRVTDIDRYGRSVGVIAAGRTNINGEMVHRGGAWAYRRYLSDQRYVHWEAQARKAKRGLWRLQPDQIMAPWEYRAAKRSGRSTSRSVPAARYSSAASTPLPLAATSTAERCGVKWKCGQMSSCAEAVYQLRSCALTRLDGDGDGVPCEKLCR